MLIAISLLIMAGIVIGFILTLLLFHFIQG